MDVERDSRKIREANVIPLLEEYEELSGEDFPAFNYERYPYGADGWIEDLRNAVKALRKAMK